MEIVIINGQNHHGSTRLTALTLAKKVGGNITEFFLPRDFASPCTGCGTCFNKDLSACPHYEKICRITEAMDNADLIILASPVYVFHATGPMLSFLDHYGTRFLVHRPNPKMFKKQAVCIATAAGGGIKSTLKDMYDSLFFWGIPKIYRLGIAVFAMKPSQLSEKTKAKIEKKTTNIAKKIIKNQGKTTPMLKTRLWFEGMRFAQKHFWKFEPDVKYWEAQGFHGRTRPWQK